MAFDIKGLSYMPGLRGTSGILTYTTGDASGDVLTGTDYFNHNEVKAFLIQQNIDLVHGTRVNIIHKDGQNFDCIRLEAGKVGLRGSGFNVG